MSNESEGWLRTLYVEAWKQYSQEDNLSQSRNNLFLGVQAAMIAILTGISGLLIRMEPIEIGSHRLLVGLGTLGVITVTFAVFASCLAAYWKGVTKSGRAYMNLRWIAIRAIEDRAGLHSINLAGMEHNWREFSKSNPGKEYHPFADSESLKCRSATRESSCMVVYSGSDQDRRGALVFFIGYRRNTHSSHGGSVFFALNGAIIPCGRLHITFLRTLFPFSLICATCLYIPPLLYLFR